MKNQNDKKQRTERSCIEDLPLLCLDLICSYMAGCSLLAVHEAFPLSYSSFLKPLMLERKENDKMLWRIIQHRNQVKTKGLSALKRKNWNDISILMVSFLFWCKGKTNFLSLIEKFSQKRYFMEFFVGMFSYLGMFGISSFKKEYLTEIEKKIKKSKTISCMLENLDPSPFVNEYVLENLQFCDSKIFILASEHGYLEVVKLLLQNSRVDPSDDDNYSIQS